MLSLQRMEWGSEVRNSLADQPVGQPTGVVRVAVTRLPGAETLDLPAYETELAAGLDLAAAIAARNGLTVLNAPGTIDADYRGEIKVILANLGEEPFTVERGMRIAQMVVAPVTRIAWNEVDALPDSARGAGGFGSTGGAG